MQIQLGDQDVSCFCYVLVRDFTSAIIYALYLILLLLLAIATWRLLSKTTQHQDSLTQNYNQQSKQIIVYKFMLGWNALVVVLILYAIFLYYYQIYILGNYNALYSKYIFIATFFVLFVFETIVFISIWLWINQYFHMLQLNTSPQSQIPTSIYTQFQQQQPLRNKHLHNIVKISKWYCIIRILPFVVWLILQIISQQDAQTRKLSISYLLYQTIQSTFTLLLLIFSSCLIKSQANKRAINKISSEGYRKKFRMVMMPTCFRMFMITVTVLGFMNEDSCRLTQQVLFYPWGLKALGGIGIYIFPYFVLLRAFQIKASIQPMHSDNQQILLSN